MKQLFLIAALVFSVPAHASEVVLPSALPGDTSPESLDALAPAAGEVNQESKDIFEGTVLPEEVPVAAATNTEVFDFPILPAAQAAAITKPKEKSTTSGATGEALWQESMRTALIAKGAGERIAIDGVRYGHNITEARANANLYQVQDIVIDKKASRFSGKLVAVGKDAIPFRGRYGAMRMVPVLKSNLSKGSVISEQDIEVRPVLAMRVREGVSITDPEQLIGKTLKRVVAVGRPLRMHDLILPIAVSANSEVEMEYSGGGLQLSDRGTAIEKGAIGDVIRVRNSRSGQVLRARVEGQNRVSVNYLESPSPLAATTGESHAIN